jgi:hypothetical protein
MKQINSRDFRKAYISTIREITKKIFPKSFYYSTLGRNDIDSIYYNSKRTNNNKNNNRTENQSLKCCICFIKKNELVNTSNLTKENASLLTVNNINVNSSCLETTKFIENNVNKITDDNQTDINNNNNNINHDCKNVLISNFQALAEDQSSLLYIDNDANSNDNDSLGQDLVVFKLNFSSNQDGSDDVFEQETTPQLVSFNKCEIVDVSRKNILNSDRTSCSNTSPIPIINHENIFSKFRKSLKRNHHQKVNHSHERKIDLNYELGFLKHDLEYVKDKMKDSDSFLTANTLTDATSSKKDSLITNNNNIYLSEKRSDKMRASQRIKRIFLNKNSNSKKYNQNCDKISSSNSKKDSFIFFKNNNKTPVSKLIDENVTVFRV